MLSRELATPVAASFLVYYYGEFVKTNGMTNMLDLYGDSSQLTLTDIGDETPLTAQGKRDILLHLAKVDALLAQRKVEIITADSVPLPDGGIQIVCQGVMYLRQYRRVFLHVFVLMPTPHRPKTYYIASDYIRFVNAEEERVPPGVVVLAPDQVAMHLIEETRRREQEMKHKQLLEMQLRIRQQTQQAEEAAALEREQKAKAAAALKQQQQQQQHPQPEQSHSIRIPMPSSRQQAAQQQEQQQRIADDRAAQERRHHARDDAAHHTRDTDRHDTTRADRPHNTTTTDTQPRNGERGRNGAAREVEHREQWTSGRGPREERGARRERAAAEGHSRQTNAPRDDERGARRERAERKGRPRDTAATTNASVEGAAGSSAPARRTPSAQKPAAVEKPARGKTAFVRLCNVPTEVKLSDIKAALAQGQREARDVYWFGRQRSHAVVQLHSEAAVEEMCKGGNVTVLGHEVKVVAFYK